MLVLNKYNHTINRTKPFSAMISLLVVYLQVYEKLISGMYLGELTRLVLVDVINQGILFSGKMPGKLAVKGSFPTWFMSQVT